METEFNKYTDEELLEAKERIEEELSKRKIKQVEQTFIELRQTFIELRQSILKLMSLDVKIHIIPENPYQNEHVIRPTTTETISLLGYDLSFSTGEEEFSN